MDDETISGRAARACLHLLPPGARDRGQVALTLRTLGGLTTPEIARAFLVPEATMAQRLVRAKRKIKAARDPVPRPARPICFPTGWPRCSRSLSDLQRGLRRRARGAGRRGAAARARARRADAGRARGPRASSDDAAARRPPRGALRGRRAGAARRPGSDPLGRDQIAAGRAALDRALALAGRGPYVLQAAIASLHADEPATGRRSPRSTASSHADHRLTGGRAQPRRRRGRGPGPRAGLTIVDRLDLSDYHYLHATRGELLRRLGRTAEAQQAYARASSSSMTTPSAACSSAAAPSFSS